MADQALSSHYMLSRRHVTVHTFYNQTSVKNYLQLLPKVYASATEWRRKASSPALSGGNTASYH